MEVIDINILHLSIQSAGLDNRQTRIEFDFRINFETIDLSMGRGYRSSLKWRRAHFVGERLMKKRNFSDGRLKERFARIVKRRRWRSEQAPIGRAGEAAFF